MGDSNSGRLTIEEVNGLSKNEFIRYFGGVVENWKEAAEEVFNERPFEKKENLVIAFRNYLSTSPFEKKIAILQSHPKLGSKADMTEESKSEQKSAGFWDLKEPEEKKLEELNNRYIKRFGFPFVICARRHDAERVTEEIERRLNNSTRVEVHGGIEEVKAIVTLRLCELVSD